MSAHVPAEEHAHPTPGTYAKIGLILFVLTALEVGLYEITYGESAGSFGHAIQPFFIPLLLFLSAIKMRRSRARSAATSNASPVNGRTIVVSTPSAIACSASCISGAPASTITSTSG